MSGFWEEDFLGGYDLLVRGCDGVGSRTLRLSYPFFRRELDTPLTESALKDNSEHSRCVSVERGGGGVCGISSANGKSSSKRKQLQSSNPSSPLLNSSLQNCLRDLPPRRAGLKLISYRALTSFSPQKLFLFLCGHLGKSSSKSSFQNTHGI